MKVSVITPSYNQGKYIRRTIDSVLSQDIKDLEYLVMDGGSTDETVETLKSYGNRIIWESKKDRGQTDAVNKGLRRANGEIIGWLNSDDIYYPNAIKSVLDVFKKNPEITVVYGNAYHIREDDSIIEEYYTEDFSYERLKELCFICQPALFFRKNLVDKYGYLDDTLQFCMDYDYWLRLGKTEEFFHIPMFLAGSRLYDDNKTLGARKQVHEEMLKMLKKNLKIVPPRWIYNLAHVIVDEQGIPREKNGEGNPEFVNRMANEALKLFVKWYKYIPFNELRTIIGWKKQYK